MARKNMSLKKRNSMYGYLFTLPWLIGFLLFSLFPLVYSFYMSFSKVTIGASGIVTEPIGAFNYVYAFTLDFAFITALLESIKSIVLLTPLILVMSLFLAILLNQKIKFRGFFRAIYFLPVVIISGSLVNMLASSGVFAIIDLTESTIYMWLESLSSGFLFLIITFLINNIFIVLWFSGVQILIYMSGLLKIDQASYEAAQIDGASPWQVFWKITFPSIHQFTLLNAVYTIVLLATFPTSPVVELIENVMFSSQTNEGMGYAAALSWIYFVVVLIILGIFLLLLGVRSKGDKGGKR